MGVPQGWGQGVAGQSAMDHAENLEANLQPLLNRAKSGDTYKGPPVRRTYFPRGAFQIQQRPARPGGPERLRGLYVRRNCRGDEVSRVIKGTSDGDLARARFGSDVHREPSDD
jgi:hypothetical protein